MRIPQDISYEELGHNEYTFPAFSPDYVEEDIGKSFDLTVTLIGYQLDTEAVSKLIKELNEHLITDRVHKILNGKSI